MLDCRFSTGAGLPPQRRAFAAALDGRRRPSAGPDTTPTWRQTSRIRSPTSTTRSSSSSSSSSSRPRPGRRRRAAEATGARATAAADKDADVDAERAAAIEAATALYTEAWSRGNIRLLDAIMAPDHVQNDAVWQPAASEGGQQPQAAAAAAAAATDSSTSPRRDPANAGRDRMKRGILAYRRAYPDVRFEVLDAAATPQPPLDQPGLWRVFVHWRAGGTNLGPIRDAPPTGRRAEFSGVNVATVRVVRSPQGEGGVFSAQLLRSDVYRQAPADEAAYFLSRGVGPGLGGGGGGGGGSASDR